MKPGTKKNKEIFTDQNVLVLKYLPNAGTQQQR